MTGKGLVLAAWFCLTASLSFAPTAAGSGTFAAFDPRGQGSGYPDSANGRLAEKPVLTACRIDGHGVRLDGRLDDTVWRAAEAAAGFVQFDPERGGLPSEETVFKVVYDEDALYFGVACYETDVSQTSSTLCRRDKIENSDIVSIYVDPYHDKTTGYNFRVNPHGVVADAYMFNDGERDWDWDAVWEAETYRDSRGWYVEVRIPFSSIRYRPADTMTWGMQVYRWMHGRGEDTAWVNWDRELSGFISRFGELTGIEGIPPPRQLEITPYVVQRSTDPSVQGAPEEWDDFQNVGADIKYGVTADLTLNATLQPDFGQVEADPAILNLSPFETWYDEKRPFFIEGARFFEHPHFNLFYSRRIGTGNRNSRIRFAGKLTGKTAGGFSVATLFAATDVTGNGQAHNPFKSGTDRAYYGVVRLGKEFADGNHRVNLIQTGVLRDERSRWIDPGTEDARLRMERDAASTGLDFEMNFKDRMYNVQGSFVGTIVDPKEVTGDPTVAHDPKYGTGGHLQLGKNGGEWRGQIAARWESDKLDPNDLGFLTAPDEIFSNAWLGYQYNSDESEDAPFQYGNVNLNLQRSWLYAGRDFRDPDDPQRILWSYERGHRQTSGGNINTWWRTRSFWSIFGGVWLDLEGTSKYRTRSFDGVQGPLMTGAGVGGGWLGFGTDWRKNLTLESELNLHTSRIGARGLSLWSHVKWVQSQRLNHRVSLRYENSHAHAQWVDNFANPGGGIADVSYVFGELDYQIWDLTVRSSLLFTRNQSLEIYLQPFVTVGTFRNARELLEPDTYDLGPYRVEGFDVADYDFKRGSVNLNLVYRWEYRSGSTIYFVWTHSRYRDERRGDLFDPAEFDGGFSTQPLTKNEPENTLLFKMSYWFSI